MKSKYSTTLCLLCGAYIANGAEIRKVGGAWFHGRCLRHDYTIFSAPAKVGPKRSNTMSDNNQQEAVMSKQTIDSKGLHSTPFSHEDHINGDGSLLTAMAVTRDELAILAANYQTQVDDYETDRERYPEDGISSREWNRYVYAQRRLERIKAVFAEAAIYEGMEEL